MSQCELYCWARKMDFEEYRDMIVVPLDHTWVTDYANPGPPSGFTEPIPENLHYWFCWGVFHSGSDSNENPAPYRQFLGPVTADLDEALCICEPNVQTDQGNPSWSHSYLGKIYGQHGVCHQAANRILWSAGVQPDGNRVTVQGVEGWKLSWFVYGPYGYKLTPGMWPISQCSGGKPQPTADEVTRVTDPSLEQLVKQLLGSSFDKVRKSKLLQLRGRMLEQKLLLDDRAVQGTISADDFAIAVNRLVADTLQQARAEILDETEFKAMFGVSFDRQLLPLVVDPQMARVYALLGGSVRTAGASS